MYQFVKTKTKSTPCVGRSKIARERDKTTNNYIAFDDALNRFN